MDLLTNQADVRGGTGKFVRRGKNTVISCVSVRQYEGDSPRGLAPEWACVQCAGFVLQFGTLVGVPVAMAWQGAQLVEALVVHQLALRVFVDAAGVELAARFRACCQALSADRGPACPSPSSC